MLRCLGQVLQQHAPGTSHHGLHDVVKCYHGWLNEAACSALKKKKKDRGREKRREGGKEEEVQK